MDPAVPRDKKSGRFLEPASLSAMTMSLGTAMEAAEERLPFSWHVDAYADTPRFYAAANILPMLDLQDQSFGGTAFAVGSNRWLTQGVHDSYGFLPVVAPLLKLGDMCLYGYNTLHTGMNNLRDSPRPMLFYVYTEPQFKDPNYKYEHVPEVLDKLAEAGMGISDIVKAMDVRASLGPL
eukprot:gnl/MRDRNA2_/MRDRNA2_46564_c0_seq1.p1 gnl/MRDRNA2_/MRDRNA2_46564_c0~~gnl/MRDRNA2_/MRDRNA2_46564_c0_seq1.p1  ORF type:complete len:195 (+),score=25.73 gnl/MRDRNA2_/MRDRNA2_46564_c0_seq1:50-586(+)